MTDDRKPFNIKLSAEEKARLEEHRIAMGLRSHAEVIRMLIDETEIEKSGGVISFRGTLPPNRGAEPNLTGELKRSAGTAFVKAFEAEPVLDNESRRMKAALDLMKMIEELPIEQRLPADKVAAMKKEASPKAAQEPFKSRLKGEWKAP